MVPQLCSYCPTTSCMSRGRVRKRGGGREMGRKRGRGVSEVDVSECPSQSLQQDLETFIRFSSTTVFPSYALHVASSMCTSTFLE